MSDAAQRRLLDRLTPETSRTGRAVRVLATTHDLDAEFFDSDFLCTAMNVSQADFKGHSGQLALQRKLAELDYCGVLCEASAYQKRPSLRTVVHPVTLPGAALHAKLVAIEYEHAILLLLGSANLTSSGFRHNQEIVGAHLVYWDEPERAAVAAEILDQAHASLAVFEDRAAEFLKELRRLRSRALEWAGSVTASGASPVVWSDSDRRLHESFLARWWPDQLVSSIHVVSPFWSEDGTKDTPLRRFLSALRERGVLAAHCTVTLHVEAAPLPDGRYVPKEPLVLYYADFPGVEFRVVPVSPVVDPNDLDIKLELTQVRRLHAKVVVLESRSKALGYGGSGNFTRNGWGLRSQQGGASANIEAGWIFEFQPAERVRLLPPSASEGEVLPSLLAPLSQSEAVEPLEEPAVFWPHQLLSAELAPSDERGVDLALRLRWLAGTPDGWLVHAPGHDSQAGEILAATSSDSLEQLIPLAQASLEAILVYRHIRVCQGEESAEFPVNVAQGDARLRLPLSPAGTRPGESDLLAYYQGRITFDDLFPPPEGAPDPSSNSPQPRVTTACVDRSLIQSYQIRAFVDALSGIKKELIDARGPRGVLYQAFRGEVSPTALARLVEIQVREGKRSVTAAAFQLVELGVMLADVLSQAPEEEAAYQEMAHEAADEVGGILANLVAAHPSELGPTSAFRRYREMISVAAS